MKKMLIAAAIVCAAIASTQAAAFAWKSSGTSTKGVLYDGNNTKAYTTFGSGVTLYMFDVATYSQSAAYAAMKSGTSGLDTSKKVSSTTLASTSKLNTGNFDYGEAGNSYDFYFVAVFDKDSFYISTLQEGVTYPTSGTKTMTFDNLDSTSKAAKTYGASFDGAGVYNIPEPTSGLLLLVGMAGLALRRRRA